MVSSQPSPLDILHYLSKRHRFRADSILQKSIEYLAAILLRPLHILWDFWGCSVWNTINNTLEDATTNSQLMPQNRIFARNGLSGVYICCDFALHIL